MQLSQIYKMASFFSVTLQFHTKWIFIWHLMNPSTKKLGPVHQDCQQKPCYGILQLNGRARYAISMLINVHFSGHIYSRSGNHSIN